MQFLSGLLTVPTLLSAMPTDDVISAQARAGAVGGAILGTLIGVGVGLIWLLLTRGKSRGRKNTEDTYDIEEVEVQTTKKVEKKDKKDIKKETKKSVQKATIKVEPQSKEVQSKPVQPQSQEKTISISPMLVTFVEVENPQNQIPIVITDEVIIGRNGERCDITIKEETISGIHCKLYKTDKDLFLIDLASTNGTFVNGVKANKIMSLNIGDVIQIGLKKYIINY